MHFSDAATTEGYPLKPQQSRNDLLEANGYILREAVEKFVHFLQVTGQLVRFEGDRLTAAGANKLLVRCYPSESLRHLVMATKAAQLDVSFLEHGSSLSDEG